MLKIKSILMESFKTWLFAVESFLMESFRKWGWTEVESFLSGGGLGLEWSASRLTPVTGCHWRHSLLVVKSFIFYIQFLFHFISFIQFLFFSFYLFRSLAATVASHSLNATKT